MVSGTKALSDDATLCVWVALEDDIIAITAVMWLPAEEAWGTDPTAFGECESFKE